MDRTAAGALAGPYEPGPIDTSFQSDDPRSHGCRFHERVFEPAPDGTLLIDQIVLTPTEGIFTRLMFDGLPLRVLFMYRHWRTRRALQ